MRTIGLLGGMSWDSSIEYYRVVNEETRRRLGGHHCARVLMHSFDFGEIRELQKRQAWDEAADLLLAAARGLEEAGADVLVLCTNLMHRTADRLEAGTTVPFLHIADAVGERARALGLTRLGVLGARPVMEETFYADRLARHGIEIVVPDEADRTLVDRVVFDELTQGRIEESSRQAYREVIERLAAAGADGVVLACTEIGLLVRPEDSPLPLLDTGRVHAEQAVTFALAGVSTTA